MLISYSDYIFIFTSADFCIYILLSSCLRTHSYHFNLFIIHLLLLRSLKNYQAFWFYQLSFLIFSIFCENHQIVFDVFKILHENLKNKFGKAAKVSHPFIILHISCIVLQACFDIITLLCSPRFAINASLIVLFDASLCSKMSVSLRDKSTFSGQLAINSKLILSNQFKRVDIVFEIYFEQFSQQYLVITNNFKYFHFRFSMFTKAFKIITIKIYITVMHCFCQTMQVFFNSSFA